MDDIFTLHPDSVFLRREALAHGYDDRDLRAARRDGAIVRIRYGAYARTDRWEAADDRDKHLMRASAVLLSHDSELALSHTTAAVAHGLRLYQPDLDRIHVTTRTGNIGRTDRDLVYHQGACDDGDLRMVGHLPVVDPVRAGLEAASLGTVAQGVVVLDSVVHLEHAGLEEIQERYREVFTGLPHARKLQVTVRLVRAGSESVAESLGRHMMWTQHVPEPVLQFEVRDEYGNLIGRTDYAWPEYGVLGEMDGKEKYQRWLRPGETAAEAVVREKTREDQLRERTGWLMIRLIWREIFQPGLTGARIREQLRRGQRLIAA